MGIGTAISTSEGFTSAHMTTVVLYVFSKGIRGKGGARRMEGLRKASGRRERSGGRIGGKNLIINHEAVGGRFNQPD